MEPTLTNSPGPKEGSAVRSHLRRPLGNGDGLGQPEQGPELGGFPCFSPSPRTSGTAPSGRGLGPDLVSEEPHHCGRAEGPWTLHTLQDGFKAYSRCSQ